MPVGKAAKKKSSAKSKARSSAAKKRVAARPKPKPKPKKKTAVAKRKAAARPKTKTRAAAKPSARAKTAARPAKKPSRRAAARALPASRAPRRTASRPSERALEVSSQLPAERPLTDDEREAMTKVAHTAQRFLAIDDVPEEVVRRIASFVDEVCAGNRAEPKGQDLRLGLGVLWGEQVRAQVGWRWVHLTYPNGFASYALVPDDRAFACFPLNRLPELMKHGGHATNTSARLFERIRAGELPARHENAYLVIG